MRKHTLATSAIGLAVVVALAACSSSPSPRTRPDRVERTAVAQARTQSLTGQPASDADDDDSWTQLWTPTQAAGLITRCVQRGSDGLVTFQADRTGLNSSFLGWGISFDPGAAHAESTGGVGPPFFDESTIDRVIRGCFSQYPIDFRLQWVALADRPAVYSYDATVLRRCLLAHGQHVPHLPDRDHFEGLTRAGTPYNAYDLVVVKTRAEWYALADACPALPPRSAAHVDAAMQSEVVFQSGGAASTPFGVPLGTPIAP